MLFLRFYQVFLFDFVFILHPLILILPPYVNTNVKLVGIVFKQSILFVPALPIVTHDQERLYLHCREVKTEGFTYNVICQ